MEEKKQNLVDTIIDRIDSGKGLFDNNLVFGVVEDHLRLGEGDMTKMTYVDIWMRCERARAGQDPGGVQYTVNDGVAGLLFSDLFVSMKRICERQIVNTITARIENGEGLVKGDHIFMRKEDGADDNPGTVMRIARLGGGDRASQVRLEVWARCERARAGREPDVQYEMRDGVAGLFIRSETFLSMKHICETRIENPGLDFAALFYGLNKLIEDNPEELLRLLQEFAEMGFFPEDGAKDEDEEAEEKKGS